MLETLLSRPKSALALGGLVSLLAVWLALGVEWRSSRRELAPPDDPLQARWDRVLADYEGSEFVVACLDVPPGTGRARAGELLERLSAGFAARTGATAFFRIDIASSIERGLYLLPPERLEEILLRLEPELPRLGRLVGAASIAEANRELAAWMRDAMAESSRFDAEAGGQALELLVALAEGQRDWVRRPRETTRVWTAESPRETLAAAVAGGGSSGGFMKTRDGSTYFAFLPIDSASDSHEQQRGLIDDLRRIGDELLRGEPGFRLAFTGTVPMAVEEMEAVRRDTWKTSAIAFAGVSLLTLLVFRWKRHALLAFLALGAGILWSIGAVRLELGYLNLITSSFVSTLIGVGVAYAIHPVAEYEQNGAHTGAARDNLSRAFRRTAGAVAIAALTTSAAFFSILLMENRGFAELGLVAGVGVLLCLAACMTVLPALLAYLAPERASARAPRKALLFDRLGVDRLVARVCRRPRTVLTVALLVSVAAALGARGIRFDTNLLELLPRGLESAEYQERMLLDSEFAPVFNLILTDSIEELQRLAKRVEGEPSISRLDSVHRLLAREPERTRRLLEPWAARLAGWPAHSEPAPLSEARFGEALAELEATLEELLENAFAAGIAEAADPLERARAAVEETRRTVEGQSAEAWSRLDGAQRELYAWFLEGRKLAESALAAEPPSLDDLPRALRDRFVTASGRFVAILQPAVDVFDPVQRAEYVAATARVSPRAIGFPSLLDRAAGKITSGFYRTVAVGAAAVFLLLLVQFRHLGHASLAALPLAMGLLWTLGGMAALGIPFNFANLVAVPLIIGVGIDNGVHVVHRFVRERATIDTVMQRTIRAILIATLTTMVGFGSLAFGSHRGISSLGKLLILGVGSCLFTSVFVLPCVLILLRPGKRAGVESVSLDSR